MIKISKYPLIIALLIIIYTNISMALEEPKYQIIKSNKNYEIRKYKDRLAVEVEYSNEDSGFRYLFNYISGANTSSEKISMTVPVTQSVKIDMTAPVTQTTKDDKMLMQFFLPSKFTLDTAPKPTNKKVSLVVLKGCYYAVIKYSGRVTDKNFQKHYKELKEYLIKDNINFTEPAIRATFNGPFTLPAFRRNEVMMKINYNESS
tara:strand:- start:49 stop:660 length:612 start_codon:yes stop_codon:yes gene_type:complete